MMNNNLKKLDWSKKIEQIYKGKGYFEEKINVATMAEEDTILLLLTENESCIVAGMKYLPIYMKQYHKKRVYLFTAFDKLMHKFNVAHTEIIYVSKKELDEIGIYLRLFDDYHQVIYLCDNDRWGAKVEYLLHNNFFTLDEYVALGIFGLKSYL